MPTLMERQLDPAAGYMLQRAIEERGIKVVTKASTKAILGDRKVEGVELADGRVIPATLVIMAAGIRPNAWIAKEAGIDIGRGILVDDGMRTSDPTSWRSANAPRSAATSTASSRRCTRWRASPRRISPAMTPRASSTTTRRPS